jgi:4-alpha-glucanotransferase
VVALRDEFGLPGIRILQFAFGDDPMRDTFRPESYGPDCIAYSGTHDNDTVRGWFNSEPGQGSTRSLETILSEKMSARHYFGTDGTEIHLDFLRALLRSDAGAVVVPLQDLFGLGSEARMNTPGHPAGNWTWRLESLNGHDGDFERLDEWSRRESRGRHARPAPIAAGPAV